MTWSRRRYTKTDFGRDLELLGFAPEVRFHPERRWRFDWARGDLAVEYEGGVFGVEEGHRAVGKFLRDVEKYNAAATAGYRVIRVTAKHVADGTAMDWVLAAIGTEEP